MSRTVKVDGVEIILTKAQEEQIKEANKYKPENIDNILDAEEILKSCKTHIQLFENEFKRPKDWISYQIETIIKAANFIDNGRVEWIPDFNNQSQRKHYPYFEKKSSGWVLGVVSYDSYFASMGSGFYFMKESTAQVIAKKHIMLYSKYLP